MTEITLVGRCEETFSGSGRGLPGIRRQGSPLGAGVESHSGAVSGPAKEGERGYAEGITALTTRGTSIRPSICWRVRMYNTFPGVSGPNRPITRSVMSL
jgi:hypothetical protein